MKHRSFMTSNSKVSYKTGLRWLFYQALELQKQITNKETTVQQRSAASESLSMRLIWSKSKEGGIAKLAEWAFIVYAKSFAFIFIFNEAFVFYSRPKNGSTVASATLW